MKANSFRLTLVLVFALILMVIYALLFAVPDTLAHNGQPSIECGWLRIHLSAYNGTNHISVSIDGSPITDTSFGSSFDADYGLSLTAPHSARVDVFAHDDPNYTIGWSFVWEGSVSACQTQDTPTPSSTPLPSDTPPPTSTGTVTARPPTETPHGLLTPHDPHPTPFYSPTPTETPCPECGVPTCETFRTDGREVIAYPLDDGSVWRVVGQDVTLPGAAQSHNNGHVYSVLAFIDAGQAQAVLNGLDGDVVVSYWGVPCSACPTPWGYDDATGRYFFGRFSTVSDLAVFIAQLHGWTYAQAFGAAMQVAHHWAHSGRPEAGGWYEGAGE